MLPIRQRLPGESRVWLTAMGLSIGLAMVATLLGVVGWYGIGVFWPKRVIEYRVLEDGKTSQVAGVVVQRRSKIGTKGEPIEEIQLYTGNRETYGLAFRYLAVPSIKEAPTPQNILLVERVENGNLIAYPNELISLGGQTVKPDDPTFTPRLHALLEEVADRREEIYALERHEIGKISRRLNELRRSKQDSDALAIAELEQRSTELSAKAKELRKRQNEHTLAVTLPTGEKKRYSLEKLIDAYYPNQLGTMARCGRFFANIWNFASQRPRESNTEGGIWPAIFGTFFMTILMSAAVVPFGVITAIYLREYAKQGPMVRSVRIAINNLAGVPSIVFGVFGVGFFVYFVGANIDQWFFSNKLPEPTYGTGGILWAALTLALMTVPVVIVATEEAIAAVPRGAREGSLACGASKWQTIQRIILPASVPGILTGLILAMARGAGEVAPLMLVGVVKLAPTLTIDGTWQSEDLIPFVHLHQKFMHLGFHIYDLGFQSPDSDAARPMVFATTLLLILLVLVLNLTAILMRDRLRRRFAISAF